MLACLLLCECCVAPGEPTPDVETDAGEVTDGSPSVVCTPAVPPDGPVTDPYPTVLEEFAFETSRGVRLEGMIRRPDPALNPELCFPAVVQVPGGINPGRMEIAGGEEPRLLAEAGMVVVGFNAAGRVLEGIPDDKASEGEEDFNGTATQDDLCEVVTWAAGLPYVIPDNVGLRTQSYGITMGAGCAGRHPEAPIKYLVDGEGPSWSFVTCHGPRFLAGDMQKYDTVKGIFPSLATWQDDSAENLAWWAEREARELIGGFRGYYVRLQATWDHAQPPGESHVAADFHHPDGWPGGGPAWYHNMHTDEMIRAAVEGGVPWVRINLPEHGNTVNAVFDYDAPPSWLPGVLKDKPWAVRAVLEMANLPADPDDE